MHFETSLFECESAKKVIVIRSPEPFRSGPKRITVTTSRWQTACVFYRPNRHGVSSVQLNETKVHRLSRLESLSWLFGKVDSCSFWERANLPVDHWSLSPFASKNSLRNKSWTRISTPAVHFHVCLLLFTPRAIRSPENGSCGSSSNTTANIPLRRKWFQEQNISDTPSWTESQEKREMTRTVCIKLSCATDLFN